MEDGNVMVYTESGRFIRGCTDKVRRAHVMVNEVSCWFSCSGVCRKFEVRLW